MNKALTSVFFVLLIQISVFAETNILIIGSTKSIENGVISFSPDNIAAELDSILSQSNIGNVTVTSEDIYKSSLVKIGLGGSGTEYDWNHYRHSLTQYYYWPKGNDKIISNLLGQDGTNWDYVVILGDPYIISKMPGFYALGVNKIASKVTEGGGQPLLLQQWPANGSNETVEVFKEHSYRISQFASVSLPVIPAGVVWSELDSNKIDISTVHPSPNGAYTAAASIYAHIYEKSASNSGYTYDNELADAAFSIVDRESKAAYELKTHNLITPFSSCGVSDKSITYNHTGTSSERGILVGLKSTFRSAVGVSLSSGTEVKPYTFNYGRANTNFEANKRYKVDTAQFKYSFGFPMQDHSNHGNLSMLFGIDKRLSNTENGTDLGVARKMINDSEIPSARGVPIRTLYAQMKELYPAQSAYSDSWHMNKDLDKAIGAYIYTTLTGHLALGDEPSDSTSDEWRSWMASKLGYETAWTLSTLKGKAPSLKVEPDTAIVISRTKASVLSVQFLTAPSSNVTVSFSSNIKDGIKTIPQSLVFTPQNYSEVQMLTLYTGDGEIKESEMVLSINSASSDVAFNEIFDRWKYTVEAQDFITPLGSVGSSNKLVFLSMLGANVNIEFYEPVSKIKVLNSLGRVVYQKKVELASIQIPMDKLGQGVLYLEVTAKNGTRQIEKFLIE